MNPTKSLIIGVLTICFSLVSFQTLETMFPAGATNFINFYIPIVIVVAIVGIVVRQTNSGTKLGSLSLILLLVSSVITITLGALYSYQLKTDEYLFFFLATLTTNLVFTYLLFDFLTYTALYSQEKIQSFSKMGLGILLSTVAVVLLLYGIVNVMHIWILVLTLSSILYYLYKTETIQSA